LWCSGQLHCEAAQCPETGVSPVQKSREQIKAEGNRIAAFCDYSRLAKLRYDEGYSSYIDVLDAQRQLFDLELQYIAVQGDVYSSLVDTYKAMGGGCIDLATQTADETDFPHVDEKPE
jgi:multidrug efflux system outer membrane protein